MWTAARSSERGRLRRLPAGAARAAAILLLLAVPATAASDPDEGPGAALDREIGILRQELAGLEAEENDLTRELDTLALREAISRRVALKTASEKRRLERQVREEAATAVRTAAAAEESRRRAGAALREIYKQSGLEAYASLLSVSGPSDLLRGFGHLEAFTKRQADMLRLFADQSAAAESAAAALRARSAELEETARLSSLEEATLRQDRENRMRLLERVRKDRALHGEAVAELSRAASDLMETLRNLPPGAPAPRPNIAFSRLRGGLPWPARGSVAVPFGQVRHPRFGTTTPHPGIDLRVEPGASVRSVGAGRVLFNRRHGGYGRTVVVDHGERYLSVYAKLAAATVQEGQEVFPGQEVGLAPEADEGGRSIVYFELRHQGKAIDPSQWLRGARAAAERGGGR